MASVSGLCPACGAAVDVRVGQSSAPGHLVWWRSYACGACGFRAEEDGEGRPDEEARRAILAEGGEWVLAVDVPDRRAALAAAKLLREALGLSLEAAARLRARIPGPVAEGTRAEMEALRCVLHAGAVPCSVRPAP